MGRCPLVLLVSLTSFGVAVGFTHFLWGGLLVSLTSFGVVVGFTHFLWGGCWFHSLPLGWLSEGVGGGRRRGGGASYCVGRLTPRPMHRETDRQRERERERGGGRERERERGLEQ